MLGDSRVTISNSEWGTHANRVTAFTPSLSISISSCIKLARDVILQVSYFQIAEYNYPDLFISRQLNSDFLLFSCCLCCSTAWYVSNQGSNQPGDVRCLPFSFYTVLDVKQSIADNLNTSNIKDRSNLYQHGGLLSLRMMHHWAFLI